MDTEGGLTARVDEFGIFADLRLGPVRQRLRWLPAGRFMMGAAATEAGRFDNEGPRHEVVLTRGFWLFDTACTQTLWQSVTTDNPSRFPGGDRPVEQINWHQAQAFLSGLGRLAPGLSFVLPTEAQWEYACRAGSEAAYATGTRISPAQANFLEYDEDDQPRGLLATVPAARFPPNRRGLYQMHGNVWEWCADGLRAYGQAAAIDPVGPTEDGAPRAIRGGSWGCDARHLRAAYRAQYAPSSRSGHLGLRCICLAAAPDISTRKPLTALNQATINREHT